MHPNTDMLRFLQVAVLSVLTDEAALHLLPPLHKAPGGADAYIGMRVGSAPVVQGENSLEQGYLVPTKPQREVLQVYAQMDTHPAFEQAVREKSMVADLVACYKQQGWL